MSPSDLWGSLGELATWLRHLASVSMLCLPGLFSWVSEETLSFCLPYLFSWVSVTSLARRLGLYMSPQGLKAEVSRPSSDSGLE